MLPSSYFFQIESIKATPIILISLVGCKLTFFKVFVLFIEHRVHLLLTYLLSPIVIFSYNLSNYLILNPTLYFS